MAFFPLPFTLNSIAEVHSLVREILLKVILFFLFVILILFSLFLFAVVLFYVAYHSVLEFFFNVSRDFSFFEYLLLFVGFVRLLFSCIVYRCFGFKCHSPCSDISGVSVTRRVLRLFFFFYYSVFVVIYPSIIYILNTCCSCFSIYFVIQSCAKCCYLFSLSPHSGPEM